MAWTDLTFSFGSLLTGTKMTQLDDNFDALAAGESGAPAISLSNASDKNFTSGSQNISSGATWTPSAGAYLLVSSALTAMRVEINVSSTWRGTGSTTYAFLISDGSNQRLFNNSAGSITVYYQLLD